MRRESHVRFSEGGGVRSPSATRLVEALGDRIEVSESPWLSTLLVAFNSKRAPYDDARVRRALSFAIDRWGAAAKLQNTTFLKYVGGIMRPGSNMATPESELVTIPGFSRDITSSREEARRLLAEAGIRDLKLTIMVRDIPMPHYAGADLLAESWRQIDVTASQDRRNIWDW